MAKNDIPKSVKCSFCGKTQDNVRKIIAGPGVYICNECVGLCNEIIDAEYSDEDTYTLAELIVQMLYFDLIFLISLLLHHFVLLYFYRFF